MKKEEKTTGEEFKEFLELAAIKGDLGWKEDRNIGKELTTSFTFYDISAFSLDEFINKVNELSKSNEEISNIISIVVTKNPSESFE